MAYSSVINDLIKEQLLHTHVAFIAKILSVANNYAKIQPLGKLKQYGRPAQSYAPIDKVPIANSARYKIQNENITFIKDANLNAETKSIASLSPISKGDIVLCICCDRNISAAIKGENTIPPSGSYHDMSNSIIVSII